MLKGVRKFSRLRQYFAKLSQVPDDALQLYVRETLQP